MNEEKKGMLAATIAYTIFGLSYLFSKMAMSVASPDILLCARFLFTLIVMNLLVAARVLKLRLKGKNLLGPILLGFVQPVAYFYLENYGLNYTTTSFTGMISAISPVVTALLGVAFLRETPTGKQWLGICLSILGVLIVSLKTAGPGGMNTPLGCLCLVAAYSFGSFYSLFVRRMSKDFSPFELTYIMFTVGALYFLAAAFVKYGGAAAQMLSSAAAVPKFAIAVVFLGGFSTIGAYMLANYSLARLPVARSTIFSSLSTIVSVLSGVLIMHDPFSWISAACFALIMAGVWIVNRFAKEETEAK